MASERTIGCCFRVKHPYQEIRDTKTCDDNQLLASPYIQQEIEMCVSIINVSVMLPENSYSLALSRETTEPAVNSRYGGQRNQQLILFLVDGHSAKRFLVDTGAAVSVYPASFLETPTAALTRSLVAANGSNIATYGTRRMNIRLENQDEIKARWKESFETLLNVENEREEFEPTDPVQGPIPSVNDAEIKKQLSKMGRNKACGPDDFSDRSDNGDSRAEA